MRTLEPSTLDICSILVTIEYGLILLTRVLNVFALTKCYTCNVIHHKKSLYSLVFKKHKNVKCSPMVRVSLLLVMLQIAYNRLLSYQGSLVTSDSGDWLSLVLSLAHDPSAISDHFWCMCHLMFKILSCQEGRGLLNPNIPLWLYNRHPVTHHYSCIANFNNLHCNFINLHVLHVNTTCKQPKSFQLFDIKMRVNVCTFFNQQYILGQNLSFNTEFIAPKTPQITNFKDLPAPTV